MRPKGSAQTLEQRRRHVVRLLEEGMSPLLLVRRFGVSRPTLYRWRRLAQSPHGLGAKPRPKPMPRLSDEQLVELDDLLHQGARVHGWPSDFWTGQRIARLIERHFRVTLNPDHVLRILRQRRGWTIRTLRSVQRRPPHLLAFESPILPSRRVGC
jgi:transposase